MRFIEHEAARTAAWRESLAERDADFERLVEEVSQVRSRGRRVVQYLLEGYAPGERHSSRPYMLVRRFGPGQLIELVERTVTNVNKLQQRHDRFEVLNTFAAAFAAESVRPQGFHGTSAQPRLRMEGDYLEASVLLQGEAVKQLLGPPPVPHHR